MFNMELAALMGMSLVMLFTVMAQGFAYTKSVGVQFSLSARDEARALPPIVGRLQRAVRNQLEAVGIFVPVVLVAILTNASNSFTAYGAVGYVMGRALYPIVYAMGWSPYRSIVWGLSQACWVTMVFGVLRGNGIV